MSTPAKPAYTYLLAARQTMKAHPLAIVKILAAKAVISLLVFYAWRFLHPHLAKCVYTWRDDFWGTFLMVFARTLLSTPVYALPFILCASLQIDGHARLLSGITLLLRNYGRLMIAAIPLFLIYFLYLFAPWFLSYKGAFFPPNQIPLVDFGIHAVILFALLVFLFRFSFTLLLVIEWPEESAWFLTRESRKMMRGRASTLFGIFFWSLPIGAVLYFINRKILEFIVYPKFYLLPLTLLSTLFFMWVLLAWVALYAEIKE